MPVAGPFYAAQALAAPVVGNQLATPANAVGPTEGNYATLPSTAAQNVAQANLFTFGSQLSAIPDDAAVTEILVEDRVRGSSSAGVSWRNGLSLGDALLLDQANQTALATTDAVTPWRVTSGLPTAAQLKDPTFGNRVRAQRTSSQSRVFYLDWTRITVTYEAPQTASREMVGMVGI